MSGGQLQIDNFGQRMASYDVARGFPSIKGPSYLSVHLRFGAVSICALAQRAVDAMVWLSELIWRDFYFMILYQHPHVGPRAFKPEYEAIR